jgi:hypothetical protein
MTAKILSEMSVGLTPEIAKALNIATEFSGPKPSQYGHMAILERLVREGFLKHPGITNYESLTNKQPAE